MEYASDFIYNTVLQNADGYMRAIIFGEEGRELELLEYKSIRHMVDWTYRVCVSKNLKPIENIPHEDKMIYCHKAKKLGLDEDETEKAAHALYFFDYRSVTWV
jgi:hypothetical protein